MSYALATTDARQQKSKGKVKSKVVHSSVPAIREIKVPVPPIEIQCEIVRILDNFTNLTAELTAELAARKNQYEFYRDKLVTYDSKTKIMPLKDVAEIERGTRVVRSQLTEAGLYPVFQNALTPMGYYDKANRLGNNTFLICAGAAGQIGYSDVDFWAADDCYTFKCCEKLENRYLFHVLKNSQHRIDAQVRRASIPRISREAVGSIRIPIPPLDVQNRIVNVLDNFEKICSDLNIGLPAEIEARQKQYEYYRDKLLTFAENGNTILSRAEQSRAEQSRAEQSRALIKLLQYVFGYAVVSLQDVVKNSCSGGTPKKGVSEYYEDGNIPWLRTQEVVFRDICKTECFITESAVKNSAAKWIPENCVIVAISGATAGRCAINKIPLTTNQHCLNLEVDPEMALYRYVYYCICAKQEELLAKKEGARGDLNSTRILSLQIDLPSIEKQKRIVSILDCFDAICNDLTSSLPAEIEARQKQYEYYRDKLLTFKEVAAT